MKIANYYHFNDSNLKIFQKLYLSNFITPVEDSYWQQIDAQLQRWIFLGDRYGLAMQRNKCVVMDVREYRELTPWIVTTKNFVYRS